MKLEDRKHVSEKIVGSNGIRTRALSDRGLLTYCFRLLGQEHKLTKQVTNCFHVLSLGVRVAEIIANGVWERRKWGLARLDRLVALRCGRSSPVSQGFSLHISPAVRPVQKYRNFPKKIQEFLE